MKQIPGLTDEEVLDIIEKIVNYLSVHFQFGYFDRDDISQEARIEGLKGLENFVESRGDKKGKSKPTVKAKLETFLLTHIRNRLINLRRNKLYRRSPPCDVCKYQNKNCPCPKYEKWLVRNEKKKNIMEPANLDPSNIEEHNTIEADTTTTEILRRELILIIDRNLPVSMRADYKKMVDGLSINKFRRENLINKIKEILKDYGTESDIY